MCKPTDTASWVPRQCLRRALTRFSATMATRASGYAERTHSRGKRRRIVRNSAVCVGGPVPVSIRGLSSAGGILLRDTSSRPPSQAPPRRNPGNGAFPTRSACDAGGHGRKREHAAAAICYGQGAVSASCSFFCPCLNLSLSEKERPKKIPKYFCAGIPGRTNTDPGLDGPERHDVPGPAGQHAGSLRCRAHRPVDLCGAVSRGAGGGGGQQITSGSAPTV